MEDKTQQFIEELDKVSLEKWNEIYDVLKGKTDIYSITFGIFPSKEMLERFGLNDQFRFVVENANGKAKMTYYYNEVKVQPQGYYLLPTNYREVPLLEMLQECVKQDTYAPDIKPLQIDPNKPEHVESEPISLSSAIDEEIPLSTLEGEIAESALIAFDDDSLMGNTAEEARKICNENNLEFRITLEDGKSYVITDDLRVDRINAHIENGIVTKVNRG